MNVKEIKLDMEQMELQKAGLDIMANAVKITLGPKGRTATIQDRGKPKVTKDGVTVARSISILNQFQEQGAQLALETCMKSNNVAGDGTTTAIILAQAIMEEGMNAIKEHGYNPIDIKIGIEMATKHALASLINMAREVESDDQLLQVGCVSSNGDEHISKIIVEALGKAGRTGMVTYRESSNLHTSLNVLSGYHFARGYHEEAYCNVPNKLECVLENALVLITSIRLNNLGAIHPYIQLSNFLSMPLLIITEELEGQSRAALVGAVQTGQAKICVVKAPGIGELRDQLMGDIAMYTGGKYIRHDKGDKLEFDINRPETVGNKLGVDEATSRLGRAARIVVNRESTTILGGNRDEIKFEEYCDGIYGAHSEESDVQVKALLQERLARLTSGVVEILVGGATEAEMIERKDRVEDTVNACRGAKEEGILPGGGIALLHLSKMSFGHLNPKNEGQKAGIEVIKNALTVPIQQLCINAGVDVESVLTKIALSNDRCFGWDVANNRYGNMYELGIIDPLKVVRSALEGASSIAGLMLGNGCTIVDYVTMQQSGQLSPLINI